ncbi:MAG: cobalamin-dependent protein [Syntrophobacteraceae bacterium]|nr:cobalamin-dependent protein [Syntrophobacteraceae bacterium]
MPENTINSTVLKAEELAALVADLREEETLSCLERRLAAGESPAQLLLACRKGMRLVGAMHEQGHYYISGLIMAGEIMRRAVELLRPVMVGKNRGENSGRVLLGTIEGDLHDIGKNLFRDLLECHGFTVLDLGVDVPPADFIAAALEFKPHVVAASALITDSFPRLQELVRLFEAGGLGPVVRKPFILIGGGQVDERVFRMSGADQWGEDAFAGVLICQRLMEKNVSP